MSQAVKNKAFIEYADCLRVFSVLAVIALHSSASGVVRYGQITTLNWWGANAVDSMCRWAVPVFIMLSGALLLPPSRGDGLCGFYRKRFGRVGIPLIIWSAFYFYWKASYYGDVVDRVFISNALKSGLTYNHLYFLVIIIGLYIVTPLLWVLIARCSVWTLWLFAGLAMLLPLSGVLFTYVPMNTMTIFVPYVGYYLIGYLVRSWTLPRHIGIVSVSCYVCSSIVIAYATGLLVRRLGIDDPQALRFYNHFHPVVLVQALSTWFALRAMYRAVNWPWWHMSVRTLGPLTFGVYLVHVVFLDMARRHTSPLYDRVSPLGIVAEVILVYMVSTAIIAIVRRIPIARYAIGTLSTVET